MTKLTWHDLQFILMRLPKRVLKAMRQQPGKIFVAGGCIRSIITHEEISDFDLFVSSKEAAIELANSLAKDQDRAKNDKGLLPGIWETDNAYTLIQYKPSIQIIHRWTFDDPCKCVESFDFTIAQAAVWWSGESEEKGHWESCISDRYYADLASRRLIYTAPKRIEEVGGSMLRVLKFYQRGYRIPIDSLGAVIARLLTAADFKKIESHDDFEGQAAKVITGLLREVDPNIDPKHISHLPAESMKDEVKTNP